MPLKGLKGSYTYSFGCITSFAIDRVVSAGRLLHGERSGIRFFGAFAAFGPRYQELIDVRFKFFHQRRQRKRGKHTNQSLYNFQKDSF